MERNDSLTFLLWSRLNPYMTPYQFFDKAVSFPLLNENAMHLRRLHISGDVFGGGPRNPASLALLLIGWV